MAKSFGCDDESANELVQEMYMKMIRHVDNVNRIMYSEEEINTYYVYLSLRNLYLDGFHRYNRDGHFQIKDSVDKEFSEPNMDEILSKESLLGKIEDVVSDWYWYDKKMWDIHFYDKKSMRKISKETKISLSSIFITLSNAKERIREETSREYSKYKESKKI